MKKNKLLNLKIIEINCIESYKHDRSMVFSGNKIQNKSFLITNHEKKVFIIVSL